MMERSRNRRAAARPIVILAVAAACAATIGAAFRSINPSTNPAGVTLLSFSSESHSGGTLTNGAGARAEVAGGADASADLTNGMGAAAFVGPIDPVEPIDSAADPSWRRYRGERKP
jgi:hypothetical protein